ncbi:filamin-A [Nematostella vectensis]|uniref:filamin-A n=1 Tax=Nematostella vectensis TaxID=45351 RepID=UPI001390331D|nr:filamin-A [Nematostella vectensis]
MACKFMNIQCLGLHHNSRKKTEPANCTVSGDGLTTGAANQPVKFTVRTKNPDLVYLDVDIARIIKERTSDPKPEAIPIEFECVEENLHRVTYFPKVEGEYQLAIKWRGVHVPGSPFLVKVGENDASSVSHEDDVWLKMGPEELKDRHGRK